MNEIHEQTIPGKQRMHFLFIGILIIYILIRVIVWQNNITNLEDADSARYLIETRVFKNFAFNEIINFSPDSTPFYPFFSGLFSLPGWSVETGARLCSLFFSIVLFFAIIGIGKHFTSISGILVTLFIITFNAVLMRYSISVLTEPSYIAVIYLGFWLFCSQNYTPTIKKGLLLGIIFGLGFLDRTEGILFLAAIPSLQLIHFLFFNNGQYSCRKFINWTLLFILGFSLISLPQILMVSNKMGTFAINGRQAWGLMLSNPDGKTYEEKKHGLDYSPKEVNIEYIQTHPNVIKIKLLDKLKYFVEKASFHYTQLYQARLSILIGPFGLIFFGFGLLSLLKSGRLYELFIILSFIGITLFAPAVWSVDMRTLMVSAPIIMLVEGIGIVFLSNFILESFTYKLPSLIRKGLPYIILLIVLLCCMVPFVLTLKPPDKEIRKKISGYLGSPYNSEYDQRDYEKPLSIINIIQENKIIDKERKLRIVCRKSYFPYLADATRIRIPYSGYGGLVRYCQLNDVDYLFLNCDLIKDYPFLDYFQKGNIPDFQCLYSAPRYSGKGLIELYRYIK